MDRRYLLIAAASAAFGGCATPLVVPSREQGVLAVTKAEGALAATMAARDHMAFMSFNADDGVSVSDGKAFARSYSTWRLDDDGRWRVVLDDGYAVCAPCAPAQ